MKPSSSLAHPHTQGAIHMGCKKRRIGTIVLGAIMALTGWSCGDRGSADREFLQSKYGLTGASFDRVPTPDGSIPATIVPVTLANGEKAQLIIPQRGSEYPVYLRDDAGLSPVVVDRTVDRDHFVRSRPVMVERRPAEAAGARRKKRGWQKEVLIVAGGSGAGAAIGGLAGRGKGAAIGALSGGVAGLVYDLATRK
jgi:hypothetical protein